MRQCHEAATLSNERGFALVYMVGRADRPADLHRPRGGHRPGLRREGAVDQGRGRGGAGRGAQPEQRRPERRGGADLQGELPGRLPRHLGGHRSDDRLRILLVVGRSRRPASTPSRSSATATLPTTFMQLANFKQVTVSAAGEATRRMVDLSLVLDVSSSIGSKWGAVRDAVAHVHRLVRPEQRSDGAAHLRQRRARPRRDAEPGAGSTRPV